MSLYSTMFKAEPTNDTMELHEAIEKQEKKVLLILSGGMDSTTLLYDLLNQKYKVECISFNYRQRHRKELEAAVLTCSKLNVVHAIIEIDPKVLKNSALTNDIEVPEGHYADENMKLTVVPNRNMIFLATAIGYALSRGIYMVAYGAHAGDHTIYPDCRREFVEAMQKVAQLCDWNKVEIFAPYLDLDKGDIAIKGRDLNVNFKYTWTCYKGEDKPCGKCGADVERKEAFEKAGIQDPLVS